MRQKGQAIVIPVSVALEYFQNLMVSPPASIAQRNRRNRNLLDLTYFGVNAETVRLAPEEAMQIGRALERYLIRLFYADPRFGVMWQMKNDLSDCFFRIPLNADGIPQLGSILPALEGDAEPTIMFHTAAPMGWTSSPPWACAVTETIADVVNKRMAQRWNPPVHPLEELAATPAVGRPPASDLQPHMTIKPMSYRFTPRQRQPDDTTEVFVDDFPVACQGLKRAQRLRRILLHVIDEVFEVSANVKAPSSVKKLREGDASLDVIKEVLGWIIDSAQGTVALPVRRQIRLNDLLDQYPRRRRRARVSDWQSLIGELRSMALGVPGLSGHFSILQKALDPKQTHVKLTAKVHDQLDDIRWLTKDLASRPTRIAEIVKGPADYLGAPDACGRGLGGVWLNACEPSQDPRRRQSHPPLIYRLKLPDDIRRRLVTFSNPHGDLTMGEYELAARVLGDIVLALYVDLTEANVVMGSDSSNTTAWDTKQSASSFGARAHLLRLKALLKRQYRYQSHTVFLPGKFNLMADDASRLLHLTDSQLVQHFNTHYPQSESWKLCQIPRELNSVLISSLRCDRVEPEAIYRALEQAIASGRYGAPSAARSGSPSYSLTLTTPSPSCSPSCSATEMDGSPSKVIQYLLERWRMSRGRSARRSSFWGPRTFE